METQPQRRPERWRGQTAASDPAPRPCSVRSRCHRRPSPASLSNQLHSQPLIRMATGAAGIGMVAKARPPALLRSEREAARRLPKGRQEPPKGQAVTLLRTDDGSGNEGQGGDWESDGAPGPEEEEDQRQQGAEYGDGRVAGEEQGEEEEEEEYPRTEEGLAQMAAGACDLPSCLAPRQGSRGGGGGFFRRLVSARECGLRAWVRVRIRGI